MKLETRGDLIDEEYNVAFNNSDLVHLIICRNVKSGVL